MRGRKPQASAVRRGGNGVSVAAATPVEASVLFPAHAEPTPMVLEDERLTSIWRDMFGDGSAYHPSDSYIMEQLVYWTAVGERCMELAKPGAHVQVVGVTDSGNLRPSEYLKQLRTATDMVLKLSDQLGCTPLSRARIGIAGAAAASAKLSIMEQVDQIMKRGEG